MKNPTKKLYIFSARKQKLTYKAFVDITCTVQCTHYTVCDGCYVRDDVIQIISILLLLY